MSRRPKDRLDALMEAWQACDDEDRRVFQKLQRYWPAMHVAMGMAEERVKRGRPRKQKPNGAETQAEVMA